jgi:hypothetical protein
MIEHEGDYGGDLPLFSDVTSLEELELPDRVTGDLNLDDLISAKGLKFPEYVGGHVWLNDLETVEGLKLPDYVGGDVFLISPELLEAAYDQRIHGPTELGGEIVFFGDTFVPSLPLLLLKLLEEKRES